jgi:adenylosuccinate lyase
MKNTPEKAMSRIFNERANIQHWLDIEASLARAQASLGIISKRVAIEISRKAKAELLDLKKFEENYRKTGHPIVALLRVFQSITAEDASEYVHLGATTQDIVDTGTMIGLKKAHGIIYESLRKIEEDLLIMAEKHANTIMAGRTHSIQALPITFGYKVIVWAREIRRNIQRLKECRNRIFVIQLSGAVGTMASFGARGPEIQLLVAKDLGLEVPDVSWHASRDRVAEFAGLLTIIAGTLGRIAQEVYLLMATEVGEVSEPFNKHIVGSSTMPHKINPQMSEQMMSLARKIKHNATFVNEVMLVDHERNLEHFAGEREALQDSCLAMGKLLSYGETMAKGLKVHTERMRANLGILKGLLLSESVMLELGKKIGKKTAYEIIHEDATRALREEIDFKQLLIKDDRVNRYLTRADIDSIIDYKQYIGFAPEIVKDMVALSRKERISD